MPRAKRQVSNARNPWTPLAARHPARFRVSFPPFARITTTEELHALLATGEAVSLTADTPVEAYQPLEPEPVPLEEEEGEIPKFSRQCENAK